MTTGLGALSSINYNYNKNFIPKNTSFTKAPSKTYPKNTNALQNQLNFMGMNNRISAFRGNNDDYSYENFIDMAHKVGLYSSNDFENEMTPENLLGSGANSEVYKFSDPRLDKWVLKVYNNSCFSELNDDFEGLNMGQEIGAIWKRYSVLKKIDGKPHSLKDWSQRATDLNFSSGITMNEARNFCRSIEKIADFPQSTFDDYAKQLKTLSDKGYKMDSINPNNLLIDYDNEKISIIDFFRPVDESVKNSKLDLINSILDFSFFMGYNRKLCSSEFLDNCKQIAEKCSIAAEKNDIPLDTKTYTDYLEWVDNLYEMHDDKSHMARYNYISNVLKI